mmetsp:Transcript_7618/g.21645  ORF Transcript_7618/g.21645 Transcript_7618/m.21645 type:complete len:92 (+) Transcript_7618:95-370(+)
MGSMETVGGISTAITLVLFVIFIIVACATIIPVLYEIEDNTASLMEDSGGDTIRWLKVLHDDLVIMQGQLNLAAGLLTSMNTSLAVLAYPQ